MVMDAVDTEDQDVSKLRDLLGKTDFKDFEATDLGELIIKGTKFQMRIGLHLNRPTQAITANGHFIKMRAAPEYEEFELIVLDPSNPDGLLYSKPEKPAEKKPSMISKVKRRIIGGK